MKDKNKVFRLSSVEESMLKKIAEAYGTNESKAIRRLIREGYNNLKGDRDMLEKVLKIYNSESEEGLHLVSKNEKQRAHVSPGYFRWENNENNHIMEIEDGDIETISYYVSNTEWQE